MSSLPNNVTSSWAPAPAHASHGVAVRAAGRVFHERFGTAPRWLAVAPGRVNLIGEHTDYNGGFVLPLAIDRHVVIAAAPAAADGGRLRVYSAAVDTTVDIRLDGSEPPGEPSWANYLRGVVRAFADRRLAVGSIDAAIVSDLPLGGGLSSSAALEVATATLLEKAAGTTLDPQDKARLCRQAEHDFAGVPCGVMDQLASVIGDAAGALLIDCRSEQVRVIPFADPTVSVLICNTNMKHALADGAYARRRTECAEASRQLGVETLRDATPAMVEAANGKLDPVVARRARHVTTENLRTVAAAAHLEAGEFAEVGHLMYASHRSLRDDFEVSSAELDAMVDIAREIGPAGGVLGSRMTGGGFGGCTVSLVRTDFVASVAGTMAAEYRKRTGRTATTFVSRPAQGAHVVDPLTVV
ncbi:MAG TPA: galactokinase [Polyangia bacterium]|nr:galactokinase [Polyangia bacterium]